MCFRTQSHESTRDYESTDLSLNEDGYYFKLAGVRLHMLIFNALIRFVGSCLTLLHTNMWPYCDNRQLPLYKWNRLPFWNICETTILYWIKDPLTYLYCHPKFPTFPVLNNTINKIRRPRNISLLFYKFLMSYIVGNGSHQTNEANT